jgi:hypothetical protein
VNCDLLLVMDRFDYAEVLREVSELAAAGELWGGEEREWAFLWVSIQ